MQLIDTHVHINFDVFEADLDAVGQRWRDAGVISLVHSCVHPGEFSAIQALSRRFPELFFAVGLHPLDAEKWTVNTQEQILSLCSSDPKVVAIGEMGLDFYKAQNQQQQEEVFLAQLGIARKLQKPVIIHCRDAASRMRDLMQDFWANSGSVAGVMHCWGGTPAETIWFLDLGFYISLSGVVTFKNAIAIQESAKMIPEDRLLVETDCPFLAPVPKRGKRNEPAYVRYVAEFVADLRGVTPEAIAITTTKNACQLFSLPITANGV
ncbi:TatD family hydrolase [Floridanema evergladense]|uniref:D-aminoacyl-tRNA deacylase n=1 Tax=Floridaenema evergladense BLCC-F167 TaxID=3153639 RepID=A0ABV4WPY2_9CYAN